MSNESIWKFALRVTDSQIVRMPMGAVILTVQVQRGTPCLWARVDTKVGRETRLILTFGTGQPVAFEKTDKYIGTYQLDEGALVLHVFERL